LANFNTINSNGFRADLQKQTSFGPTVYCTMNTGRLMMNNADKNNEGDRISDEGNKIYRVSQKITPTKPL